MDVTSKVMHAVSPGMHGPDHGNLREGERTLSILGGGALIALGLLRHNLGSIALAAAGGGLIWRGLTGHCPVYAKLGINTARASNVERAGSDNISSIPLHQGVTVEHSIIVDRPPEELFRFWRNFENLPRFMKHLKSVQMTGLSRSHWVARSPLGGEVAWDAEVVNEKQDELIAWRSLEGSDIANTGSVHFYPTSNASGSVVKVQLKYNPPAGRVGAAIARLLGEEPKQQMREDLERLKTILESGAVPLLQGQPVF